MTLVVNDEEESAVSEVGRGALLLMRDVVLSSEALVLAESAREIEVVVLSGGALVLAGSAREVEVVEFAAEPFQAATEPFTFAIPATADK
ncbi:hypothetical protein LTR36_002505 [Oleoguttula mirabilis]|uniref:Uncharacterized protein n=1 Tax=Oleoguttula mirabilis TaxID=1507867 RepID=A0AAV9JLP4_9PEZI|nr:hypothetical protein LTR36_002505 [Oleoguttula mirabilis]